MYTFLIMIVLQVEILYFYYSESEFEYIESKLLVTLMYIHIALTNIPFIF